MHSSGFFRIKLIARLILKREIPGSHTISDQSLLLSTIVLNDIPFKEATKCLYKLHNCICLQYDPIDETITYCLCTSSLSTEHRYNFME